MTGGNPFKQALAEGRRQTGLWLSMAHGISAEVCGHAGFDWALIDGEHAPNDIQTILAQLQALAAFPTTPVVRPPIGETWIIKQLLDIGARSLLIPMVDTADDARRLVRATRYAPLGDRGVGARMARASAFGGRADYIARANDDICLLVQVETPTALDNIEAIAAVEGVDGIFVGPSDLAASLGHPGNPAHPDVQARIHDALRRIHAAGKPSGIISMKDDDTQKLIDAGVGFIAVGADLAILADGARALARRFASSPRTA